MLIGKLLVYCSYLLILDRTNWKTKMLTALLIPYIFFSFPSILFNFLRWQSLTWYCSTSIFLSKIIFLIQHLALWYRGEVGRWIAIIAVVLRLFFPRHFPGKLVIFWRLKTHEIQFYYPLMASCSCWLSLLVYHCFLFNGKKLRACLVCTAMDKTLFSFFITIEHSIVHLRNPSILVLYPSPLDGASL